MNFSKRIKETVKNTYEKDINIFDIIILNLIRISETLLQKISIFNYHKKGIKKLPDNLSGSSDCRQTIFLNLLYAVLELLYS